MTQILTGPRQRMVADAPWTVLLFEVQVGSSWSEWIEAKAFMILDKAGPRGWDDANAAFYINTMLHRLGPARENGWLETRKAMDADDDVIRQTTLGDHRRYYGAMAVSNIGNVWARASENLFQRRCLIIACAVERFRLQHHAFPDSLERVQHELAGFRVSDPAQPDRPLNYRVDKDGYFLEGENWRWRMKHRALVTLGN